MCLWFAFPIGLFVAIIRQSKEEKYPEDVKSMRKERSMPCIVDEYAGKNEKNDDLISEHERYAHYKKNGHITPDQHIHL